MPFAPLVLRPGVNSQITPLTNEAGWSSCNLIRFKDGMLQKIGGWMNIISEAVTGTCRALWPWQDLNGNAYIGIGTDKALQVYTDGELHDITPVTSISSLTSAFSTTNGLYTVTINDVGSNQTAGNFIYIVNPVSVGGIVLHGRYEVTSVTNADNYVITAVDQATSTVALGGSAAEFTTTNLSTIVTVTLGDHGYSIGDIYTVYISTTVATVVLLGSYVVDNVVDADNFTIIASSAANANASGFENAGNIKVNYLLAAGNMITSDSSGLYGLGLYGLGLYGIGSVSVPASARLWSLANWGEDLIGSYTYGTAYVWSAASGVINNPATIMTNSPLIINSNIFVAMPQQQVIAVNCSIGATTVIDQLLVRWCDIADYNSWTATATNQAGSFRIPRGSHIVGAMQGPQQGLIWTDLGLWAMQYIGFPLVYGFNEVAQGCGLISQNAKCVMGSNIYWMSQNGFFRFDGNSVQAVPCPVWDKVFKNLNRYQVNNIMCGGNTAFNEIWWFYPSESEDDNTDYVKFNIVDGVWDYGTLSRTAWTDQSSFGPPIAIGSSDILLQHEVGNNDNTDAITSWAKTGWFEISNGENYIFLERLIPDFIMENATINLTFYFADYPNDTPYTKGPFSVTSSTKYVIVRGRKRLMSIKVESSDLDSFWRMGKPLYLGAPAGSR